MKKTVIAVFLLSVAFISCKSEKKEKIEVKEEVKVEEVVSINNVDMVTSVLTWKGTKLTGSHHGVVSLGESSLVLENGMVKSGEFVIKMSTIKNVDMAGSAGARDIESHLKNADFFDVEKYPTSKFVITSVANTEDKLAVTGNLTIKDVTKSITIPAVVTTEGGVIAFKSDVFNIDRADFNVKYGSKRWIEGLKDKFINDLVEMSFEVRTKSPLL
jgi:polyisoprenoid-binding protein YceI